MESTACNQDEAPQSLWEVSPENIQAIRRFPKPHDDLFELAESVPYWWQLANSAPVLAFMVARCWYFDKLPRKESAQRVKQYVLMKRSAICAAFGFPTNQRTVRLLSKFDLKGQVAMPFMITDLMILRLLLRWEPSALEILEDVYSIGTSEICNLATGLRFDEDPRHSYEIGRGSLFLTLPQCEWFFRLPASKRHWLSYRFIQAEVMANVVEIVKIFLGDVIPFTHFHNERKAVAYLKKYWHHAKAIHRARASLNLDQLEWPEPPLVSPEGILPILSYNSFQQEREEMKHCIGSYLNQILLGIYYVYRMEEDCRCTIGIRFSSGSWQIDQVRGINNEEIKDLEVMHAIENWIANSPSSKVHNTPRLNYLSMISKISGLPLRKFRHEPEN
ncbi:MAG: PcfJ domain-containing protein [bacterium]